MINLQTTMKHILLLTFAILFSSVSYSQNALYEAKFLATLSTTHLTNIQNAATEKVTFKLKHGDVDLELNLSKGETQALESYITFLDYPFENNLQNLDFSLLKSTIYKYNQYVKDSIAVFKRSIVGENADRTKPVFLSVIPEVASNGVSLGTDFQSALIDGLAKYYAEEFRKAQLVTYMQAFKSITEEVGELKILFPKTTLKLATADPADFPKLGEDYRQIFDEDFRQILPNLIHFIDTSSGTTRKVKNLKFLDHVNVIKLKKSDYFKPLQITVDVADKLLTGNNPVEVIGFLDNKYYNISINSDTTTIENELILSLHCLNLLQKNLIDTLKNTDSATQNPWIKISDLPKASAAMEWKYFAGLLYQQDKEFFDKYIFETKNENIDNIPLADLQKLSGLTINILSGLSDIQNLRANVLQDSLQKNFTEYVITFAKAIINSRTTNKTLTNPISNKFISIANLSANIYSNIKQRDYATTIFNTIALVKEVGGISNDSTFSESLYKLEAYSSFMAGVVKASDSDEIKDIIKKHAAPSTSYIQKRQYRCVFSFTGQPGYFLAVEKLKGTDQKPAFVSGLSLPLGFDLSFKLSENSENATSINFFLQLLDIGAVLNFRISDGTSLLPDKINFEQVFSPGAAISFGLKNSPLTIGIGYQYSPKLREVTEDEIDLLPNGHRLFLRASWDIPIVNIARSRNKSKQDRN